MERAQLDQRAHGFDGDLLGQPFADVVFHFVEPADGQAAADLGLLAGGGGVFLDQIAGEELGEIGDMAGTRKLSTRRGSRQSRR
jgi:hypothetical protein